jgi:hypothetical protein
MFEQVELAIERKRIEDAHRGEGYGYSSRMPDRLFAILAGRDDASNADWPALLAEAESHGVLPLFAQRAVTIAPPDVRTDLRRIQQQTMHRNMRRLRDFAIAVNALHARGIDVVALKGMQLVPLIYGNLASRGMIDIDLLVPAESLNAAAEVMRDLGYKSLRPFRIAADPIPYYAHHVPPFIKSDASTVELHWHVCEQRTAVTIDVDELWRRAVPARIGGVDTKVFASEDLLLHLAVHATYSHRCQGSARACCDVAEIVRTQAIDWDAVIERARRWNVAAGTYLVLRLARELLDAAIPSHVLDALQPPAFDERLLRIALRGEHAGHSHRLRHARGARAKLRAAKELLFIGRDQLADTHNVKRSSPLVYGLYIARAAKMAKRWREAARGNDDAHAIDTFLRGASK